MNVRTYRAATMREALELVRRELGSDAIIFSTRQTPARRQFPWQKPRQDAEVVAGVAEQSAPLRSSAGLTPTDLLNTTYRTGRASQPGVESGQEAGVPASAKDEAVEALIRQLSQSRRPNLRRDVPDELFHLYTRLIDADVHEQDARNLLLELPPELQTAPADPAAAVNALATIVEQNIRCCGPIRITPGVRTVVALVGPTGVGKTTTLAKLAANFKLRDQVKVGLVTVDTYRVAAVDQLRTYAEIIDLPMHVVSSPREMRHALDELREMDLVLIDTAGRSPRDELKIQELQSFLAEADVDQVHLVLSLVASAASLEHAATKFRPVGVTSLLLTKLDEVAGAGAILTAARRIALPISYLTTGQDVPDDIEAASTPRLARLVLSAIESAAASSSS
ncbi:MAG: flagellar biosynthesis protein FlhF [Planctomycetaceae bacterium]|nr:flagellar biosynthesis protein FlhF [Planctomycetaceae bacterium]